MSFNIGFVLDRKGGLIFKAGGSNMQHVTSLSFLLLTYSNYLSHANRNVPCGGFSASPSMLRQLAKRQVRENFNNISTQIKKNSTSYGLGCTYNHAYTIQLQKEHI